MENLKRALLNGLLLSMVSAGLAFSQDIKIGYVDLKEVFSKYEKASEAEKAFMKEVEEKQKEVGELESNIKKMQTDYDQKKDVMKPEEKSKKEAELKEKIQEFSKIWSDVNKKLDDKRKGLEEGLLEEIRKEVKAYGEKNGFTVILDSRIVIYGHEVVNLTEEIVKGMNKTGEKKQ